MQFTSIDQQTFLHDAFPQHRHMPLPRTRTARPVGLVPLHLHAYLRCALKHRIVRQRNLRQNCCSGKDRSKGPQVFPSLTHEQSSHAHDSIVNGTSQKERLLAFENTPAELDEDDEHHHDLDINDSSVHKVLAWIFSRVGLLQLAARLRGKAWSAITIACLMAVALLTAWAGGTQAASAQLCSQISTAATASIYALAGIPELVDLCFDVTAGHIDTHVLMTLAVFGTLAVGGALEGALLLVLFEGSHVLEHKLTGEAQGNLQALFDATPEHATLVGLNQDRSPDMTKLQKAKARDVAVGSHMLIRPGEQVPLDGIVVHGTAQVSWSHISGEALPVRLQQGKQVPAGTLNHDGLLVVEASKGFQDSTPARIARLTAQAQASRPKMKRWIDSFGEVYSKAIIAATIVILVVLPMMGVPMLGYPTQRGAFYRAMGFLTTASPCALVLVPLAYVSAIGAVTSSGILIQGGNVLDALVRCTTIAFDKTGTLTTGSLTCTSMLPMHHSIHHAPNSQASQGDAASWVHALARQGGSDGLTALAEAAALSVRSTHPVSQAVLACAQIAGSSLPQLQLQDFHQQPGAGVQGTTQRAGKKRCLRFGSEAFASQSLPHGQQGALHRACLKQGADRVISVLVDRAADPHPSSSDTQEPTSSQQDLAADSSRKSLSPESQSTSSQQSAGSDTQVWVFAFEDTVHERSAAALQALRQGSWLGRGRGRKEKRLTVMMLTGDNEASAQRVAQQLHIQDVRAGLSPEQKLQAVDEARRGSNSSFAAGGGVVMVGDGINDAPALAAADVGIAISDNPTAAAAAAADIIVLSKEGVASIPLLLNLAHRTQCVLRQNLILAIGSILVLALPVVLGFLPLWVAVSFHEGSTLLVALNSLRLLQWRQQAPSQASMPESSVQSV